MFSINSIKLDICAVTTSCNGIQKRVIIKSKIVNLFDINYITEPSKEVIDSINNWQVQSKRYSGASLIKNSQNAKSFTK